MTTSGFQRATEAQRAIAAVLGGAVPRDLESETLDFKEEAGAVDRTGARRAISSQDETAARSLAAEAACLANSTRGGTLVVGVADAISGAPAFTGAHLDVAWLRRRIWALTSPNLSLDEITEQTVAGARIYLIDVPPNLAETTVDGRLRARFGTECQELSGSRARELLEQRRGYDWTAEPSGLRFSQADPSTLESARLHYREAHDDSPDSPLEVARRMGVVIDADAGDPQLNRAGALLLAPFEPGIEQLVVLRTVAQGTVASDSVRGPAPLLSLIDSSLALLRRHLPLSTEVVGTQRRALRAIPEEAFREAVVNAVMHRDYQRERAAVNVWLTGDPAEELRVRSTGGFPIGVSEDRLIGSPSRPRNRVLAHALRVLGLAEMEGVGISSMYHLMLRDGHPAPSIAEDAGDVLAVLVGGQPDRAIRAFFDGLLERDSAAGLDVRSTIAVTELLHRPVLRPDALGAAAQYRPVDALATLERLAALGVVERLLNGARSFRLTGSARVALAPRIAYQARLPREDQWDLVDALLDSQAEVSATDIGGLLRVSQPRTAVIIRAFVSDGLVTTVGGRARGRGVRYRRA